MGQAVFLFRKLGSKGSHATALQIAADLRFMEAMEDPGNRAGPAREALQLAKEAISIYQDLADRSGEANALRIAANANIKAGNGAEALSKANDAQSIFRELDDAAGEAGAVLISAGAHLCERDYEEAKRAGKEAEKLYKNLGDGAGEDTALDFLDSLKKYESGEQKVQDFVGFTIKTSGLPGEREEATKSKRKGKPQQQQQQQERNLANLSIQHPDQTMVFKVDGRNAESWVMTSFTPARRRRTKRSTLFGGCPLVKSLHQRKIEVVDVCRMLGLLTGTRGLEVAAVSITDPTGVERVETFPF